MVNESEYLVRNPKLIAGYLTDILHRHCIISAHFGENNASFLTAIIDIDLKNNVLQLDWGPSEPLNQKLLDSEKVLFCTDMEGIKVSFSGKNIRKVKTGFTNVFEMPIPNPLYWRQRRQYYRVKVPLAHADSSCRIAFEDESQRSQTATFRLYDLSISGVALLCPTPELPAYFQLDRTFTDCTLHLHEGSQAKISLVVKNTSLIKTSTTTSQHRIGCQFGEIAPAFQSAIQLYMQDIERQRKNIG